MADFDSEFFIDYSSLDDFQRQLIDRKNNKSIVVSGSAGSGKSLIALHKAKQIAALGESYTIIVYTKSLRKYFEDGLRKLGLRHITITISGVIINARLNISLWMNAKISPMKK